MSQLVPCPRCERHVRLPEISCPFCGGELDAQALGARYAARRGGVPSGIKRAALMAIGTVAAACGGKTDGTGDDTAPIVATDGSGTDEVPSVVAIYGAPVAPSSSEPAASQLTEGEPTVAPTSDTPTIGDEPTDDDPTGGIAPPYGIPPWDPTSDVGVNTSAPPIDRDAGVDAGAEVDASADTSTDVDEFTGLAQPEYGAPIPEQ